MTPACSTWVSWWMTASSWSVSCVADVVDDGVVVVGVVSVADGAVVDDGVAGRRGGRRRSSPLMWTMPGDGVVPVPPPVVEVGVVEVAEREAVVSCGWVGEQAALVQVALDLVLHGLDLCGDRARRAARSGGGDPVELLQRRVEPRGELLRRLRLDRHHDLVRDRRRHAGWAVDVQRLGDVDRRDRLRSARRSARAGTTRRPSCTPCSSRARRRCSSRRPARRPSP